MIYNLSTDKKKYYRQGNNKLDPGVTCKPTATVECLDLAAWNLPPGDYEQPEDILTELCRSPAGIKRMIDLDRTLSGTKPNEVWGVIEWAINTVWFPRDRPIIGPRWDWTMREVLYGITQGRPFAASTWLTKGGHVIVVVGFETSQIEKPAGFDDLDMNAVKRVIIDDPYGCRESGNYDCEASGWNNSYTFDYWNKNLWRGIGIQVRRA